LGAATQGFASRAHKLKLITGAFEVGPRKPTV
jgi:hypothetical protein